MELRLAESPARATQARSPSVTRDGPAPDRLQDAVTRVAAADGYAALTVAKVIAAAGVSRSTFYQHFTNVEDGFKDAYRHHARRLLGELETAVRASREPELAALDLLVDTALSRPQVARLLMGEGLAAGTAGLSERDALIAAIVRVLADAPARATAIDLPPGTLIGGATRFVSICLAGGGAGDRLREDLREWASAFLVPCTRKDGWSRRFAALQADPALRADRAGQGRTAPAAADPPPARRASASCSRPRGRSASRAMTPRP